MEETAKPRNWGGKRREGKTKISTPLTLDIDLVDWLDSYAKNRSKEVNRILRNHKERIEQMQADAAQFGEVI